MPCGFVQPKSGAPMPKPAEASRNCASACWSARWKYCLFGKSDLSTRTVVVVGQRTLHQVAKNVPEHDMRFLDVLRHIRRNAQDDFRRLREPAIPFAGEPYGPQAVRAAIGHRANDVFRVAGSGDRNQCVTRPAERLHLPFEDSRESEVISAGGQDARVYGQCDGREPRARKILAEHADEFCGDVLRIGGASAVSTKKN